MAYHLNTTEMNIRINIRTYISAKRVKILLHMVIRQSFEGQPFSQFYIVCNVVQQINNLLLLPCVPSTILIVRGI